jgi:hypothetical protein
MIERCTPNKNVWSIQISATCKTKVCWCPTRVQVSNLANFGGTCQIPIGIWHGSGVSSSVCPDNTDGCTIIWNLVTCETLQSTYTVIELTNIPNSKSNENHQRLWIKEQSPSTVINTEVFLSVSYSVHDKRQATKNGQNLEHVHQSHKFGQRNGNTIRYYSMHGHALVRAKYVKYNGTNRHEDLCYSWHKVSLLLCS